MKEIETERTVEVVEYEYEEDKRGNTQMKKFTRTVTKFAPLPGSQT